jgi:hypothetical protein
MKKAEKKEKELTELTPAQEQLMDAVYEEYCARLVAPLPLDAGVVARWLETVYGLYNLPVPSRVETVPSPYAAIRLARELTGDNSIVYTDMCGTGDGGWVSFYDYFQRISVLSQDEAADCLRLRDFGWCAWDTVLLDEAAIVIERPASISLDEEGNLHSATGPCLVWGDGEREYAWHGQWVSERVIERASEYTREEFLAITNTEERRAVGEIAGWENISALIGAKVVDTWTDDATSLSYSLLRGEGILLLRKQSPKLANENQPAYVEPVHEDLRTAQAARKWQATRLTPAECEADPSLVYGTEA